MDENLSERAELGDMCVHACLYVFVCAPSENRFASSPREFSVVQPKAPVAESTQSRERMARV